MRHRARTQTSHFGSETVPVVPMPCHFSSLAVINSVKVCVRVCIQVPSYCLLSFEQRREERVPVKLASFIPSMVIIISWGLEYFIYCEPVCVCVHVCERLCMCVKACLHLVCVHVCVFMIL